MKVCAPALIYCLFVLTQIIIDIFKLEYQHAFVKFIIMIIITFLLNLLCERDLSFVSWMIVFIPFIFTTYLTFLLVYLFGYNTLSGNLNEQKKMNTKTNKEIIVYNKYPKGSSGPSYQSGWYNFGII